MLEAEVTMDAENHIFGDKKSDENAEKSGNKAHVSSTVKGVEKGKGQTRSVGNLGPRGW